MATLHPTTRIQALVPKFMEKFSCIGSACEDTCCSGWQVTLDKKTFNAYKASTHPELKPRFANQIKRMRSKVSDSQYARFELLPKTSECPMMEEKLCSVQNLLGEDKLSNTCFNFPRQTYEVGGIYHQALTLSCPEAARLALLSENAFEFNSVDLSVRPSTVNHWKPIGHLTLETVNSIRFFCIQIIKTSDMAVWQKLALLGIFCESLSKAMQDKKPSQVHDSMESMRMMMVSTELAELFNSMQPNYKLQARTFSMLWRAKPHLVRAAHLQVYEAILKGLSVDAETGRVTEVQLEERYTQGMALLDVALKQAPSFLDNYVLNEMLRSGFPFALSNGNPLDQYIRMVTRFGIVRFMLAAQCQPDQPMPGTADLVRTVHVFARRFQHDEQFASEVDSCFQNSGWNQLDKIFRFLKT